MTTIEQQYIHGTNRKGGIRGGGIGGGRIGGGGIGGGEGNRRGGVIGLAGKAATAIARFRSIFLIELRLHVEMFLQSDFS